jgi:hypothetical protein
MKLGYTYYKRNTYVSRMSKNWELKGIFAPKEKEVCHLKAIP